MFSKKCMHALKNANSTFARLSSGRAGSKHLEGKVAVVTGSTHGIGLAIAQRLARDGAKVVISSRKQINVDTAVKQMMDEGLQVTGIVCHVGQAEHRTNLFKKAVSEFGGIDILVSNAGINPGLHTALEIPEEIWDKVMNINVKAGLMLSQEVVPFMEKRGGGNIVFISSVAALQPSKLLGVYSVSKSALVSLSRILSQECAESNIRVNCIAPGIIHTKFSKMLVETEEISSEFLKQISLRRFGKAEEVASLASFLCSDDASYITGETVVVGGGFTSRL